MMRVRPVDQRDAEGDERDATPPSAPSRITPFDAGNGQTTIAKMKAATGRTYRQTPLRAARSPQGAQDRQHVGCRACRAPPSVRWPANVTFARRRAPRPSRFRLGCPVSLRAKSTVPRERAARRGLLVAQAPGALDGRVRRIRRPGCRSATPVTAGGDRVRVAERTGTAGPSAQDLPGGAFAWVAGRRAGGPAGELTGALVGLVGERGVVGGDHVRVRSVVQPR